MDTEKGRGVKELLQEDHTQTCAGEPDPREGSHQSTANRLFSLDMGPWLTWHQEVASSGVKYSLIAQGNKSSELHSTLRCFIRQEISRGKLILVLIIKQKNYFV